MDIQKELEVLVGKKIKYIYRSCDLIDIGFGELKHRQNASGKDVVVPTYALHIQCPFRISSVNGIITGSDDLFVSLSDPESVVDLSCKTVCVLDERLECIANKIKDEVVDRIVINEYGDLYLYFSDYSIAVFSANSMEMESWRFIELGNNGKHIIRTGIGFEILL